MLRILPVLAAAALLIASGVLHGLRTDRWGLDPDLEAAAARLDKVPDSLGDWQARPMPLDKRQLEQAEIVGHLSRNYTNERTGAQVSVLVVCGRSGPITRHTPDVCYQGQGYVPNKKVRYEAKAGSASGELWTARFDKPNTANFDALRIYWGWTRDGLVTAPEDERITFFNVKVLYKIYVIRQLLTPNEATEEESTREFLGLFLPELSKALAVGS
jgi:hypothetical protein